MCWCVNVDIGDHMYIRYYSCDMLKMFVLLMEMVFSIGVGEMESNHFHETLNLVNNNSNNNNDKKCKIFASNDISMERYVLLIFVASDIP